ncbi:MAG: 2,3,4,5-tetrahydropyridine-2,6-dicarboxylate N-succinyltransferase, partial [Pseudonocardia sp.]
MTSAPTSAPSSAPRREGATGTGLATVTASGTILDTWYPAPALGPDAEDTSAALDPLTGVDDTRGVSTVVVRTVIGSLADPPRDAHDVYLRLHLL